MIIICIIPTMGNKSSVNIFTTVVDMPKSVGVHIMHDNTIGYKACLYRHKHKDNYKKCIATLIIPSGSKIIITQFKKHRTNKYIVNGFEKLNGKRVKPDRSFITPIVYKKIDINEEYHEPLLNEDVTRDCEIGLHFFPTKQDAGSFIR